MDAPKLKIFFALQLAIGYHKRNVAPGGDAQICRLDTGRNTGIAFQGGGR
jgi:hypothetical protein